VRAADFQAQALLLALDTGEPHRIVRALAAEAAMRSVSGVDASGRSHAVLRQLETMAGRLGTAEAEAISVGTAGIVAFQEGRWADALAQCGEAEQTLRNRCTGHVWERTTAIIFALFSQALLGQIRRLCERLPALQKEALERGDLYSFTNLQAAIGQYPPLCADEPERGRAALHDAMARWSVLDTVHLQHFNAVISENQIDLYAGDPERAWRRLEESWRGFERSLLLRSQTVLVSALFARAVAALASGQPERVTLAARLARKLAAQRAPYTAALVQLLEGCVALRRGELERAATLLELAETALTAVDMRLHAAAVRWRRGLLIGGDQGARLVTEGQAWFAAEGCVRGERLAAVFVPVWE
jgi:hypothetical protein